MTMTEKIRVKAPSRSRELDRHWLERSFQAAGLMHSKLNSATKIKIPLMTQLLEIDLLWL